MITHDHPQYIAKRRKTGKGKFNGCYYYSKEIVSNIIPRVSTCRDWNTVGIDCEDCHDGMIVFLHDNSTPWNYQWLKKYKDLILICSSEYTALSVQYFGKTIILPMSVDTKYVARFRTEKTKDICLAGNVWVRDNITDPDPLLHSIACKVDILGAMPREKLLGELAKYRKAYAIDRCAIEAKVLGCELLPLDTRYSVDHVGKVLDNRDAARILQTELDKIDGEKT